MIFWCVICLKEKNRRRFPSRNLQFLKQMALLPDIRRSRTFTLMVVR